jgi:hypothetical protein
VGAPWSRHADRAPHPDEMAQINENETGVSVGDRDDTNSVNAAEEPNPKLVELSELLVGTWRVAGPDIKGQAEYQSRKGGCLLVADVDFTVNGTRMKVIQHITYRQESDTLRAEYMDTMGEEATYTWVLEHPEIRVSLGDKDSDTFFQATLNEDNSEYVGTWHDPESRPSDPTEMIVYTRVK